MSEIRPSCIEDLSNELFAKIFSFISAYDLYQTWSKLNHHRITGIIGSLPISIRIKTDEDFINYLDGTIEYFAPQIVYWKDDRLAPTFVINLSSFMNIRSLHLTESFQRQIDRINPGNHPYLTRLSLPYQYMSSTHIEPMLFGNEQQRFSNLRSIANVWCNFMALEVNGPINRTIQHIHLPWATRDVIVYLIQRLPELVSIDVTEFSSGSLFSAATFDVGNNVRRLNISSMAIGFSFSELKNVFLYTIPKLTDLQIEFTYCDFEKLASLLGSLTYLRKTQFKVKYYPDDFDLASIRKLSIFFATLDYEAREDKTNKPCLVTT